MPVSRRLPEARDARRPGARARGVVLLASLGLLGLLAIGLVAMSIEWPSLAAERQRRTDAALALAREALIGFAVKDDNLPGGLPCPDIDNNGDSVPGVEYLGSVCASYVGRLPWRLLRLPDLRDGHGERLWYALAPAFRNLPAAVVINADTVGQIRIQTRAEGGGVAATSDGEDLAAIVFAPGPAVLAQVRDTTGEALASNYLQGPNATGGPVFWRAAATPGFNDQLRGIASREIVRAVELRIYAEVTRALHQYFEASSISPTQARTLPAPADFADSTCLGAGALGPTVCLPGVGIYAGRLPANLYANPSGAEPVRQQQLWSDSIASRLATPANQFWFQAEGWREQIVYLVDRHCLNPVAQCTGSLTAITPTGQTVPNQRFAILLSGPASGPQRRSSAADKTDIVNYLEGAALAAFNAHVR